MREITLINKADVLASIELALEVARNYNDSLTIHILKVLKNEVNLANATFTMTFPDDSTDIIQV